MPILLMMRKKLELRRYLSSRLISIRGDLRSGVISSESTGFGFRLKATESDLRAKVTEFPDVDLNTAVSAISDALEKEFNSFERGGQTIEYYRAFSEGPVSTIIHALEESIDTLGGIIYEEGPGDDIPLPFRGADLADHLEILANQENANQFLDYLIARIRTFLSDPTLKAIIDNGSDVTLSQWLKDYVGDDEPDDNCITVIDLSLVPSEVVHVVAAVVARMVFEALQRFVRITGVSLPTVLVMEEAHTFIKRYRENLDNQTAATVCCQVFERIAREGRKFGLGLVLSSQRPSELSPAVLSQCNTFLLHRISNDRDQELVGRLVPDNLRGLLRELPSLPPQSAILLGWASELPVLVKLNDLPDGQRPRSDDPEFWTVWTRKQVRDVDWDTIAADWQGMSPSASTEATDATVATEESGLVEIQP